MPLTYQNRKGDTYYFQSAKTKKGNIKYFATRKKSMDLIDKDSFFELG